jgi:prepilin-type N-terminal cleavage/methylation domain-containing protein
MKRALYPKRSAGFTLLELLVVIAIMALLASLTMMGARYAKVSSNRSHCTGYHRALMSGLERFDKEMGGFPLPRNRQMNQEVRNKMFNVAGSVVLYQAMTGDGNSFIRQGAVQTMTSNGRVDDNELQLQMFKEMPAAMISQLGTNQWGIVDAFNKPFQYERVDFGNGAVRDPSGRATSSQAGVPTINPTYDLWSYAEDDNNTTRTDIGSRLNPTISGPWIKNW